MFILVGNDEVRHWMPKIYNYHYKSVPHGLVNETALMSNRHQKHCQPVLSHDNRLYFWHVDAKFSKGN